MRQASDAGGLVPVWRQPLARSRRGPARASLGLSAAEGWPGMPDVSSGGLPRPLTSFIGRERELAQARRLLAGSYLVTLTGPGGSGKTRLGIALAAEVAGDYPDGVFFVPLAP